MPTAIAYLIPLGLYLAWPSCLWNFDGVACAAALELGNPTFFFHSNHLLYAFLGFIFWKGIGIPLGVTRALPALQLFTNLLSALAAAGLFSALRRLGVPVRTACLATLAISVAAVVWVWSVEAQVYPLGLVGLAWGTAILMGDRSPTKYRWVGLCHALAVLGHVINVLWWAPVWYWMGREAAGDDDRRASRKTHALWFGMPVIAAYAAVMFVVVVPREGQAWLLTWLKGSAGLTPDRHWAWHSAGWTAPLRWGWSTLCFFWGSLWPYAAHHVAPVSWTLTALSAATLLFCLWRSRNQRSHPAWLFSIIWIATYGLFLWTWEPSTLCYRMTDMIPWAILIVLGVQTIPHPGPRDGILLVLALSTGFLSFLTLIRPMHDASRNELYSETLTLAKSTPETSIYLTQGGAPWIYLLYFTGRSAWNVGTLRREINLHLDGKRPVYAQTEVLSSPTAPDWLKRRRWKALDSNARWVEMQ